MRCDALGPGFLRWILVTTLIGTAVPAVAEIIPRPGIRILTPEDVEARYVYRDDRGDAWLEVPGRRSWRLDEDPASVPVDPAVVVQAVAAIAEPFRSAVEVLIVVLPAPRVELPISSAEDGLVYLSPGVGRAYTRRQVHFLVAHEFGHVVQRALVTGEAWDSYCALRGVDDPTTFGAWAEHANRPREIFAEDFRYLFGGADANYSGSIENTDLALPGDVPGLERLFLALVGTPSAPLVVTVSPQPSRGVTSITVRLASPEVPGPRALEIHGARGRHVRSLEPITETATEVRFEWDGRTDAGAEAGTGLYFARVAGVAGAPPAERVVRIR